MSCDSRKEYGLLNYLNWKDELKVSNGDTSTNKTSTTKTSPNKNEPPFKPTYNRKAIHWLFFIHSDHISFDFIADFENCAMWNYAKFSIRPLLVTNVGDELCC